ncbi:LysR substrate binding domain (plasmid) [Rubrobacter radiotolerans]|uniref:LysR substrate binding domain n=1 Tax=Rubrobacter radiotolerans TaxID=42256 RepID=A0A023X861_RUBRA|nr:LysR substrate-binding domain-containing protein [Rubrobacter radiotolerans]AHY48254.1 LysR substrate binding domain [Rubrobacter radiotolerans]MDX5895527.1 LysR substrate-binding domain-containing protein [Rubrobacter radiotolerans]
MKAGGSGRAAELTSPPAFFCFADRQEGPFISREPGSGTREVIERRLKELGVRPNARMEIGGTGATKEAIKAGLGFSIHLVYDPKAEMSSAEHEFYECLSNLPRRLDVGRKVDLET